MFETTAQELIVIDPSQIQSVMSPIEVHDMPHVSMPETIEAAEPGEIEIVVTELPGAPDGTKEPEAALEVSESDMSDKSDENDAKSKKPEKWDWAAKGATGFVAWVKERLDDVPKHNGLSLGGLERAVSYLDKLDAEISKAMRMDLDGELDSDKVEEVRAKIDDGIARLNERINKVKKSKKSRRKKSEFEMDETLIKEAQKITGVKGIFVTVPLLISHCARVCINGHVSAGHSLEDLYARQVEKFKLNEREQAELIQLIDDSGFSGIRRDRGYMPDEDVDTSSSDNFDWGANFKG